MKKIITVSGLLFWTYSFLIFWPSYFANWFTIIMNNVIAVFGVFFLVKRKYIARKLIIVFYIYYLALILITFIYKTDMATINLIVSYSKVLVYLTLADYMLKNKTKNAIVSLHDIFLLFAIIDLLSLGIFPNGLKQTEYIWNEWSTTYDPVWFLGRKNNRIFYYVILNILSIWKYNETHNYKNKCFIVISSIMCTLSSILENSSTSIVVSIFINCIVVLFLAKKRFNKIPVNLCIILYSIFEILLVTGSVAFLGTIVNDLFHKDLTFSGRSFIWNQILLLFLQKPLFGWGYLGSETVSNMLGSKVYTSAHNQWLNFIFQGGIILFIIAVALFYIVVKAIKTQSSNRNVFIMMFILLSLFINMLFEAQFNNVVVGMSIVLIYEYSITFGEQK